MTKKKTKQAHQSPAEIKAEINETKEQETDKAVAEAVQKILSENNRALQAYVQLTDSPNISVARVRLVRVEPKPTEEANNIA